MKCDHYQTTTRLKHIARLLQSLLKFAQLSVQVNANGLKGLGCGVFPFFPYRHRFLNQPRQITCHHQGLMCPTGNQGFRYPPCMAFLAVFMKHLNQVTLRHVGQPLGGGRPLRGIHAHIEGTASHEAETPLRLIQLRRGNAKIHQNARNPSIPAKALRLRFQPGKAGMHNLKAIRFGQASGLSGIHCRGILVHGQ